jgi:hypothetical protein
MLDCRAVFANRWNFGDEEYLEWWILSGDERWHDVVAGDGGSYSDVGVADMYPQDGENLQDFKSRVRNFAKSH